MDDRKALMLAWLEQEGERLRRPVPPLPQAKDPAIRGWVQVGVCGLGGALIIALLVCWVATARQRAMRVNCMEGLRSMVFLSLAGDPNAPKFPSDGSSGKGATARINGVALGIVLCVTALAFGARNRGTRSPLAFPVAFLQHTGRRQGIPEQRAGTAIRQSDGHHLRDHTRQCDRGTCVRTLLREGCDRHPAVAVPTD